MTDKIKIPLFIALGVAAGVLLTFGLMSLTTDEDSTQQENHHKESSKKGGRISDSAVIFVRKRETSFRKIPQ